MELNLYLCAALIGMGIVLHFLKKLHDLEQAGTILWPQDYLKRHPYTFMVAVLSAYLLAALLFFLEQLNYAVSILIGVACGSAYDSLRARAVAKINGTDKT